MWLAATIAPVNHLPWAPSNRSMTALAHASRATLMALALLHGAVCTFAVADEGADPYTDAFAAWSRVLATHVDDTGRIDFDGVAAAPEDLNTFVAAIAVTGPATDPQRFDTPGKVLAFHLNAYNALAMHGVIDEGIPKDFDGFFKRAAFFRFRNVRVDGERTNLHAYENDVIRPLGDPRVHFALNCMVRDCPRLPTVPFTGVTLDAQLDAATREFFGSEKYLRRDLRRRTLWLSAILDFYTEDFAASGRAGDVIAYVNRYVDAPIPADYRVKFLDYDWTVNQR